MGRGCLTARMDDASLDAAAGTTPGSTPSADVCSTSADACVHPRGGAAWLDDDGAPDLDRPVHTWITSRTVHVYGIGALLGVDGAASTAAGALDGLRGVLRDPEHGGWFAEVGPDGEPDDAKSCYAHAFVMLAGSTAVVAGLPAPTTCSPRRRRSSRSTSGTTTSAASSTSGTGPGPRPSPYRGLNSDDALARGDARGRRRHR